MSERVRSTRNATTGNQRLISTVSRRKQTRKPSADQVMKRMVTIAATTDEMTDINSVARV